MDIINSLITWRLKKRFHQIELFVKYPINVQSDWLKSILHDARDTEWGKRYDFRSIKTTTDFKNRIPLQDYESLKSDILRTKQGERNILWHSDIKWFAKSSGTTADKSKFIPVSIECLKECHYKGGKDMLSLYCNQVEKTHVFTGKTIMMGGSSQMNNMGKGSQYGDLSAILIDNLPFWVDRYRAPNKDIVLMDNWEEKIEKMAEGVINENITSLTGVPSWTLVLFNRVLEKTGATSIKEVWPNLELFMHGGVRFDPYREQLNKIAPGINYLETYNASEGYFGIQYEQGVQDFLLMLDYGIYYEFIPMSEFDDENPNVLSLEDVQVGINYAMVITTNSGLWRYKIGDTIEFTSLSPFRIRITGRTKHFINAFGEELIIDNAEMALKNACEITGAVINEYTAGPKYIENGEAGAHEWLIEFDEKPENLDSFTQALDKTLKTLNSDYEAKRSSDLILKLPMIRIVEKGLFYKWLKGKNKLGGQYKVPRLCNHRKYIEELEYLMANL